MRAVRQSLNVSFGLSVSYWAPATASIEVRDHAADVDADMSRSCALLGVHDVPFEHGARADPREPQPSAG
jgi:thiamine phosphate synthase YjbQ (UPF0047 family)